MSYICYNIDILYKDILNCIKIYIYIKLQNESKINIDVNIDFKIIKYKLIITIDKLKII